MKTRLSCGVLIFVFILASTRQLACQEPSSFAPIFSRSKPSIAVILTPEGWGTGFCVSSTSTASYYVTDQHVVGKNSAVKVVRQFPTVHVYAGTVVASGLDGDPDLAVVRIPAPNVPVLQLKTQLPQEGDPILVIGYPVAQLDLALISGGAVTPSIHEGTLSSIANRGGLLEYDAQTLPGNSGGPLLDARTGDVLGVIQAKIKSTTEANLAIGISRVVVPFLNQNGVVFKTASERPVAASTQIRSDTPNVLPALPGAGAAVVVFDTSMGTGDIAGPMQTAASDLAQKLAAAFNMRVTTVDRHVASASELGDVAKNAGALFAVPYGSGFHSISSTSNAYGTYTKWEFDLQVTIVDAFGQGWYNVKRTKTITSARTPYDAIASSLADLNDQVVSEFQKDLSPPGSDSSFALNFFRYAVPIANGSKRSFVILAPATNGTSVAWMPAFSPAAEAGLQFGDVVQSVNGVSLAGKDAQAANAALVDANRMGSVDLVIVSGDGTTQHIKFEAQDLRWYVEHRGVPF